MLARFFLPSNFGEMAPAGGIARLERAEGFEPTQCQGGSLVPFRLATPANDWSREWDLNPRSRDYQSRALPTELSLDREFWYRVQESNLSRFAGV